MGKTKTLTDAQVAKALGWKLGRSPMNPKVKCWFPSTDHKGKDYYFTLPSFTTDLNAIVGVIEAKGLWWDIGLASVNKYTGSRQYVAILWDEHITKRGWDKTHALTLCRALLDYLKEPK